MPVQDDPGGAWRADHTVRIHALNMFMRSHAARHADGARSLLLVAPGWIRTDMGGPEATFTMEETIPDIVSVVVGKQGKPGLQYLDRKGKTVSW